MQSITALFHERSGIAWHGGALAYAVGGYALGWWGLTREALWVNALAVLLLGHAMVIAAYLLHECAHNTVFRSNANNARLGRFLNWLTGSAYNTFEDIRYKHFRHHRDNDDAVWFVYEDWFARHPRTTRVVEWLEWCYVPAQDLLMHALMAVSAFVIPQRRGQRLRQGLVIAVRCGAFVLVAWFWPRAAAGYVLAYFLMMHVLRGMDMLQHDYGNNPSLFLDDPPSRFGGRATEQAHTFSNPLSFRRDWPNWLVLNFGFHNAHHLRPTVPWYRLPAFYREQVSDDPASTIPLGKQLAIYHRHRKYRVMHRGGPYDERQGVREADYFNEARAGRLYGGNAASFLVSF